VAAIVAQGWSSNRFYHARLASGTDVAAQIAELLGRKHLQKVA